MADDDKPAPRRSRWRRIAKRAAMALLALVVGLPLLALGLLHTSFVQGKLETRIEERVSERLNGSLSMGDLELSLFSEHTLVLTDVKIVDGDGREAIAVDRVDVGLEVWNAIVTKGLEIDLTSVVVEGVRLHVVKDEDGSSNLSRLVKPPEEEPPQEPKDPKDRHIVVRSLAISDVNLIVERPDGTTIALREAGLDASIDARPLHKDVSLQMPSLRAELSVEKPNLKLGVRKFRSGITVDLQEGAGKVSLAPTKAELGLTMAGAPERIIPLDLAGVDLDVAPGELGLELEKLLAGALALEALSVEGRLGPEGPAGEQRAQLLGLQVDAAKLNRLLGKDVLRSDVALDLELSGPPEKVAVKGDLKATDTKLTLTGTVDAQAEDGPDLDLDLVLEDLDTTELLALENVPPVALQKLHVTAKGQPKKKLDLTVDLDHLIVRGRTIDALDAEASVEDRVISLDRAEAEAYGQRLVTKGTVDLKKREVDVIATVDADVGGLLLRLQQAGLKVKTPIPEKALTLDEGVVEARVHGPLDGDLNASVDIHGMRVAGGRVWADVDAVVKRNPKGSPKPVELKDLDGRIKIDGVYVDPLLAWRGKQLKDMTAAVWADLRVKGVPEDPSVGGEVIVRAQPWDTPRLERDMPLLTFRTRLDATPNLASVRGSLTGTDGFSPEPAELLKLRAQVPLDPKKKKLALSAPWKIDLKLGETTWRQLRNYVPERIADKLPRAGKLAGRVKLRGSAARPRGTVALDVDATLHPTRDQRLELRTKLRTDEKGRVIAANRVKLWHDVKDDPLLVGKVAVGLTRSPLVPGPRPGLGWSVDLKVPDRDLSTLPLIPALAGMADVRIEGKGDRDSVDALAVTVDLDDFERDGRGPIDAGLKVAMSPEEITLTLEAGLADIPVLSGTGKLGRGGKGLIAALKKNGKSLADKLGDPSVELDLKVVEQRPGVWAPALPPPDPDLVGRSKRATLQLLPGLLGGDVKVRGNLSAPTVDGGLRYHGYDTISGKEGQVVVDLDGELERLGVKVHVGPDEDMTVDVSVPRDRVKPYLDAKKCDPEEACEAELPVTATIRTKNTDLAHLLPAIDLAGKPLQAGGKFSWNLDGELLLQAQPGVNDDGTPRSPVGEGSTLDGELVILDGHVDLPGTMTSQGRRQYERIGLRMLQSLDAIELTRLELHESDLEKKDRSLAASARIELDQFRPAGLTGKLEADDWLLFGDGTAPGARVGPIDAPRGALDATIAITGQLDAPIKKVKVDVQQLDLVVPYRYNRSHWPEVTHLGDVKFLDRGLSPEAKKAIVGKLPVPKPTTPPPPFDPKAPKGLDLEVDFSRKAHLQLQQLDLVTGGHISYRKRGEGKRIEGELEMHGGNVYLGGKDHKLIEGSIAFSEEHPGGYADLLFGRREHEATLRDISRASAGRVVKIHIEGPLSDRTTTLSGAGSPGTLFDLLSVHNAGRPRYTSHPDLPASMSTQFPQFNNLLMLSFFSVNVPGVLLMDKVAGWGDPYDDRGTQSYGQMQHYEAEGYAEDGSFRVRVVKNPPRAGESDAEVTVDVLFANTPQTAFGVGVGGGNRGGGGPGIFFEWSSED